MSLYTVALFLHVSGASGAVSGVLIWLFGLTALRRARLVEQVRALAWVILLASPLTVGSVVLLGVGGFEMALSTWGLSTPWIAVSLVSVVLIGPIGAFVLDPRMRTIFAHTREVPNGPLPIALIRRTHDPILMTAASTLTALLFGIVFLMTTKPSLVLAVLVMAAALALGLCVALPFWSVARKRTEPQDTCRNKEEVDPFLTQTIWTRRW